MTYTTLNTRQVKQLHVAVLLGVLLALLNGGCALMNSGKTARPAIVAALESQRRTEVAMALSVLDADGLPTPVVEIQKPYANAKPALKALVNSLLKLPDAKIKALDEALKRSRETHSAIFSPAWSGESDGWAK